MLIDQSGIFPKRVTQYARALKLKKYISLNKARPMYRDVFGNENNIKFYRAVQ